MPTLLKSHHSPHPSRQADVHSPYSTNSHGTKGQTMTQKHYASSLVGKTVKAVSSLTKTDLEDFGWDTREWGCPSCLIEFTDGTEVIVQCDPEGNGSGFLAIYLPIPAA